MWRPGCRARRSPTLADDMKCPACSRAGTRWRRSSRDSAASARDRLPSRSTRKRWSTSTSRSASSRRRSPSLAQGLIVQTTTATLGKVIEEKQILELPLSGRNFTPSGCSPRASRRAGSRRRMRRTWCMGSGRTATTSSWTAWRTCRSAATPCRRGRTWTRCRSSRSRRAISRPSSAATRGRSCRW